MENNDFGYIVWGGIQTFYYNYKGRILHTENYNKEIVFKCLYKAIDFCIYNRFAFFIYDTDGRYYGWVNYKSHQSDILDLQMKPVIEPPICQ